MENLNNILLNRRQSSDFPSTTDAETSSERLATLVAKGPVGNALMKRKSEVMCENGIVPLISSPFGPETNH